MTDKEICKAKYTALVNELNAMYDCEFRGGIFGSPEGFDVMCNGKPTVHIGGNIHNDNYFLEIWVAETGIEHWYNSGYRQIPKDEMMYQLNLYLPKKKFQMESLFEEM